MRPKAHIGASQAALRMKGVGGDRFRGGFRQTIGQRRGRNDGKWAIGTMKARPINEQGELTMATNAPVDWDAIIRDPRFQHLHNRKTLFLWGLMALSVVYYFLLPIGAAYFQDVMKIRVWGVINVGLLFALSEFAVAWAIALYYSRRAGREFDQLAAQIVADHAKSDKG